MKVGTKVAVCYDGKWARRVPGIVTENRKGHHIKVKFNEWAGDPPRELEVWFPKKRQKSPVCGPRYYYGKYVAETLPDSLMNMLFGAPGDYYSVWKWKDKK